MNNEPDYDNLYFERTNTMTQKIFDTDNEKDMTDLWDIVPDKVYMMARGICDSDIRLWYNTPRGKTSANCYLCDFLKINWHDKTEITRPIQLRLHYQTAQSLCFGGTENVRVVLVMVKNNAVVRLNPLCLCMTAKSKSLLL